MTDAPRPPICPFCGTGITVHQSIRPGHCGAPACQSAHVRAVAAQIEFVRVRVPLARARAARGHARAMADVIAVALGTDDVAAAQLPYRNAPTTDQSPDRRADMIAHLTAVVANAWDQVQRDTTCGPWPPRANADPRPVEEAGCTTCQGLCCVEGGRHKAFISEALLAGMFRRDVNLTPDAARRFYIAALPTRSTAGGCVYQTDRGCTLPRDWRADICNSYKCNDLRALSDLAVAGQDLAIALVGIADEEVNVTAWRDSRGLTPIARIATDGPPLPDDRDS